MFLCVLTFLLDDVTKFILPNVPVQCQSTLSHVQATHGIGRLRGLLHVWNGTWIGALHCIVHGVQENGRAHFYEIVKCIILEIRTHGFLLLIRRYKTNTSKCTQLTDKMSYDPPQKKNYCSSLECIISSW